MKLVRVKRYIPKWNDNRKQPKESQGWVEYNPSHPVEEIDRVRGLEDLSPLEAARSSIEYLRGHLAAVGGWQDAAGAEVVDVGGFLALCDVELFREVRDAIAGSTSDDEDEIKN